MKLSVGRPCPVMEVMASGLPYAKRTDHCSRQCGQPTFVD